MLVTGKINLYFVMMTSNYLLLDPRENKLNMYLEIPFNFFIWLYFQVVPFWSGVPFDVLSVT